MLRFLDCGPRYLHYNGPSYFGMFNRNDVTTSTNSSVKNSQSSNFGKDDVTGSQPDCVLQW